MLVERIFPIEKLPQKARHRLAVNRIETGDQHAELLAAEHDRINRPGTRDPVVQPQATYENLQINVRLFEDASLQQFPLRIKKVRDQN